MLRSLIDSWKLNLALLLAAAVATAVLLGALLVGASLEHSLRDLATERLGSIDYALVAGRFFRQELAEELQSTKQLASQSLESRPLESRPQIEPVLALVGSGVHAGNSRRSSSVSIWGVGKEFSELFPAESPRLDFTKQDGQFFPSVVLNQTLARELDAAVGDAVLLNFQSASAVPAESLLADDEATESLRVEVTQIVPDAGVGRFGLAPSQELVHNAFVVREDLQARLDLNGRVNTLLIEAPESSPADLESALHGTWKFSDLGLSAHPRDRWLSVESEEFVIRPALEQALRDGATTTKLPVQPVLTYLANRIVHGERVVPYSTVAALPLAVDERFGALAGARLQVTPRDSSDPDWIVLDRWTADDLQVSAGQEVTVYYFEVDARGELVETEHLFEVAAVAEMEGLAIDRSLTPDFPGIAEADSISDWDPPFPVDLNLIRPLDEDYWELYRGAPKAFVPLAAGQQLWQSRFGRLTSLRVLPHDGKDLATTASRLERATLAQLTPEAAGMAFEAVRERSLSGATGSTDFAGLFLAFSFFLILAAALLVALLFRLAVQQRASQIGLRLALGFPLSKVRGLLAREGLILALGGSLLGVLLGTLYAGWLLQLLQSWWKPLLEASFLRLALPPGQIAGGLIGSCVLVLLVMLWELRRLRKVPVPQLLHGEVETPHTASGSRLAPRIAIVALLAAAALSAFAFTAGSEQQAGLFFGVGAAVSAAGFVGFAWWCRRPRIRILQRGLALWGMATRSTARNATRSLLSVVLVGAASFVLVSVGANRHSPDPDASERLDSGTGGYTLLAEAELPIARDLSDPEALFDLGFSDEDAAHLAASRPQQLRLLPGDDASCLNLYRPEKPRVLGVPESFVARGGFTFRQTLDRPAVEKPVENPWQLLDIDLGDGVIPAIGDFNSVKWILQSSLGGEIEIEDSLGRPLRLRIVGLLDRSIFQSELLIAEHRFLEAFPDRTGFSYLMFEPPLDQMPALSSSLEDHLGDYGLDASPTADKLAAFEAVEGMYIATFQVLGGLGLLLGTIGLGIVLVRNVIERQGELATLRAFGYQKATLARIVVLENSFLLAIGICIGSISGLLAVAPSLLHAGQAVPWTLIGGTLAAVFIVGLLASVLGVIAVLRTPLIPVLKSE